MVTSFTPLQPMLAIAHGDLRLVCGCSAMETHFRKLPKNSYCADVTSRGSLELGSEYCSRDQGRNLTNGRVGKVTTQDGAALKVTELFSKAILLPMFVYGDCTAVCSILYTWLK
jgi:hypothetical protein